MNTFQNDLDTDILTAPHSPKKTTNKKPPEPPKKMNYRIIYLIILKNFI